MLEIGDILKFEIFGRTEELEVEYVEDGSVGGMNQDGEYGELYHDMKVRVLGILRPISID